MFGMKGPGGIGIGDMMKLMGQAGQLQEKVAQAKTRAQGRTAIGEAGAGMVKATANGIGELLDVHVDPEALKDPESLGPLITSAVNLALSKGKDIMREEAQAALGGIELPPGLL